MLELIQASFHKQRDVRGVIKTAILLLPGHLGHNAQIGERPDCGVCGRECRSELLSCAFDGETRHRWQQLEQAVSHRAGFRRFEQTAPVSGYQRGNLDDAALGFIGRRTYPFEKKGNPGFPVPLAANIREYSVILQLVLLEIWFQSGRCVADKIRK